MRILKQSIPSSPGLMTRWQPPSIPRTSTSARNLNHYTVTRRDHRHSYRSPSQYIHEKHTTWPELCYTDLVGEDRDEQPEDGRGGEPAGSGFPVDGHRSSCGDKMTRSDGSRIEKYDPEPKWQAANIDIIATRIVGDSVYIVFI